MALNRFDEFSKSLSARSTRRQAVRHAGAGGLLATIAATPGLRAASAQGGEVICSLQLTAMVAVGPDSDAVYEGALTLEIGAEGAINSGTFETPDGGTFDVVGTAAGRALDLRIELDNNQVLTLIGTGENDILLCQGQIDGAFGGPRSEDLGTWTTNTGS